MAEENLDGQEKSELPTDERREEFRKKGDVAYSREITSVLTFAGVVLFVTIFSTYGYHYLKRMMISHLEISRSLNMTQENFILYISNTWYSFLILILPVFLFGSLVAVASTFIQTRFNFSWSRLKPNMARFNILKGIKETPTSKVSDSTWSKLSMESCLDSSFFSSSIFI